MRLARAAHLRVSRVSSALLSAGPTVATMAVLALPPSESASKRVSLLSRYGMCPTFSTWDYMFRFYGIQRCMADLQGNMYGTERWNTSKGGRVWATIFAVSKGIDDAAERRQTQIDLSCFLQPIA